MTEKYKTLEYRPSCRSDIPFNIKMRSKTLPISKPRTTKPTERRPSKNRNSTNKNPDRQQSKPKSDSSNSNDSKESPDKNTTSKSETPKPIPKTKPDTPFPSDEKEEIESDLETVMG